MKVLALIVLGYVSLAVGIIFTYYNNYDGCLVASTIALSCFFIGGKIIKYENKVK